MKFTFNWLKDYLDTTASLNEVTDALTRIGLEVESVQDYAAKLKDFVVAKIETASPHPNAAKLQVCAVNDGDVTRQIVCGAANARAGLYVVLAREGVLIPANGMVIKKTKIRDVESNGMLCSLEELGLSESSEGIVELAGSSDLGGPVAAALGFDDAVIDIAITPNRGDCFSVYGVARDLAAAGLGTLKAPIISHAKTVEPTAASPISVATSTSACSYFVGCSIRGVKNTESPEWLKRRLVAVGQRPISALVDITNYMLMTFGRPLHVYDMRKLTGNLSARDAREGETLKALNGNVYTLDATMCVIADDSNALGIAGVMGGEASGCQPDTSDVFLESAMFDPISIANTGRKLELLSDARQRFERGVDAGFVKRGAEIARDLIVAICGGEASMLVEAGQLPAQRAAIAFRPSRVAALTGVSVEQGQMQARIEALGFTIKINSQDEWHVTPPSWRYDMQCEEDVVEEVIRLYGYQHIPLTPLPIAMAHSTSRPLSEVRAAQARKLLVSRGFYELCNWSFISPKQAEQFGEVVPALTLQNPISADLSIMRGSLLSHLLLSAMRNANRGVQNLAICEVGLVFQGVAPDEQQMMASGLRSGAMPTVAYQHNNYSGKQRELDVFDAKSDAFALLSNLGISVSQLTMDSAVTKYYHPHRSIRLTLGGKILVGYVGELHPGLVREYGLSGRVIAFEVFLDSLPQAKSKATTKRPISLPAFPEVERDFAFSVAESVAVESLLRAVRKAEKQILSVVEVFDVYSGKGVADGMKSVAIKVKLQPIERTLTDEDIQAISKAIIDSVAAGTGGSLRV